ncbi:hypothetical protein C0J52_20084 [Blattella germanica]|nr:hypothetical protein C0J52_20084 [Blattella germanica]
MTRHIRQSSRLRNLLATLILQFFYHKGIHSQDLLAESSNNKVSIKTNPFTTEFLKSSNKLRDNNTNVPITLQKCYESTTQTQNLVPTSACSSVCSGICEGDKSLKKDSTVISDEEIFLFSEYVLLSNVGELVTLSISDSASIVSVNCMAEYRIITRLKLITEDVWQKKVIAANAWNVSSLQSRFTPRSEHPHALSEQGTTILQHSAMSQNVNTEWQYLKRVLQRAANEALGKRKKERKKRGLIRAYECFEEVHAFDQMGSNRFIDIVAFKKNSHEAYISYYIDPTIRYETNAIDQAEDVNEEKENIYESCISFTKENTNSDLYVRKSRNGNYGYTVFEEVPGIASNGSNRRIDIIAFKPTESHGLILDPTVRFETHEGHPEEVDTEKRSIYEPTVSYYKDKYKLENIHVVGLMVGARGTIPKFWTSRGLQKSHLLDIAIVALKGSLAILRNHLFSACSSVCSGICEGDKSLKKDSTVISDEEIFIFSEYVLLSNVGELVTLSISDSASIVSVNCMAEYRIITRLKLIIEDVWQKNVIVANTWNVFPTSDFLHDNVDLVYWDSKFNALLSSPSDYLEPDDIIITAEDIANKCKGIKVDTAPGEDGVRMKMPTLGIRLCNNSRTDLSLTDNVTRIQVGGVRTDPVQDDPVSPMLFNLFINHILDQVSERRVAEKYEYNLSAETEPLTVLCFAGDIVLIGMDTESVNALLTLVIGLLQEIGFSIKSEKSNAILMNKGMLESGVIKAVLGDIGLQGKSTNEEVKYLEILQLPSDTPNSVIYTYHKYKGISIMKASWEAYLQQLNVNKKLQSLDDPHINILRKQDTRRQGYFRTPEFEEAVLSAIQEQPSISTLLVANDLRTHNSSVFCGVLRRRRGRGVSPLREEATFNSLGEVPSRKFHSVK